MKTAAKKVNEIEKIIQHGEVVCTDINEDWLRRKLRALVRKAVLQAQYVQSLDNEDTVEREGFKKGCEEFKRIFGIELT